MSGREFMRAVAEAVRPRLPPELRDFEWRATGYLMQLHYGDPAVHFEAWARKWRNCLEIGLHFESRDRGANERLFRQFDHRLVEIKAELGPRVELERWDKGWAKVYGTIPLAPYKSNYVETVAERLARMVTVLQPMCGSGQRLTGTVQ